jgi:hypothetical protein
VDEIALRITFIFNQFEDLFQIHVADLAHLEVIDVVPEGEVRIGENDPGRYDAKSNRIILQETPDDELLLHEIAHHFIGALEQSPKPWANEGIAVYVGWSAVGEDRIVQGELPLHHVLEAKKLLEEGKALSLRELMNLDPSDFYVADVQTRGRLYSQSWALVFFLIRQRMSHLPFATQVRSILRMTKEEVGSLEAEFRYFWREFSPVQELKRELLSRDWLRRRMAAIQLGLLGDIRGVAPLMHVASDVTEDFRTRLASLNAIATIAVQRPRGEIEAVRSLILDGLVHVRQEHDLTIAETAARLSGALKSMDKETLLQRFASQLANDPVYPSRSYSRRRAE